MKLTDKQVMGWIERHDLGGAISLTDARAAISDAQSIDLASDDGDNEGEGSDS